MLLAVRGRRLCVVIEEVLSPALPGLEVPFAFGCCGRPPSSCRDESSLAWLSSVISAPILESLRIVPASDPGLRTVPLSEPSSSLTPARFREGESRRDLIETAVCREQFCDSVESLNSYASANVKMVSYGENRSLMNSKCTASRAMRVSVSHNSRCRSFHGQTYPVADGMFLPAHI